jgi:hypothetical protein
MEAARVWRRRWTEIARRAEELRDSPSALPSLFDAYRLLDASGRAGADAVISEAVESSDETTRFDALALVREFRIKTAVPNLDRLADRLALDTSPGAPYELDKVHEILGELGASAHS